MRAFRIAIAAGVMSAGGCRRSPFRHDAHLVMGWLRHDNRQPRGNLGVGVGSALMPDRECLALITGASAGNVNLRSLSRRHVFCVSGSPRADATLTTHLVNKVGESGNLANCTPNAPISLLSGDE